MTALLFPQLRWATSPGCQMPSPFSKNTCRAKSIAAFHCHSPSGERLSLFLFRSTFLSGKAFPCNTTEEGSGLKFRSGLFLQFPCFPTTAPFMLSYNALTDRIGLHKFCNAAFQLGLCSRAIANNNSCVHFFRNPPLSRWFHFAFSFGVLLKLTCVELVNLLATFG